MQFQKGQSGNPDGRPRGSRNKATILLRDLLDGDSEAIARKAIELAKQADIAAIRVCLERLVPPRRSEPIVFELPPLATAADSSRRWRRWWRRSRPASSRRRKRPI